MEGWGNPLRPTYIKLRNFKAIGDEPQTIQFAPITLLFGQNSAGKSTVLQALIYLREVLVHGNCDADKTELGGEWLDLGGFQNLVHGHKHNDREISIELGFSLDRYSLPDFLSTHERDELDLAGIEPPSSWLESATSISVSTSLRWSEIRGDIGQAYVSSFSVSVNEERFATIKSSPDGRQVFIESLNMAHPIFDSVQLNIENLEDPLPFQQYFMDRLDPAISIQAKGSLEAILSAERPFKVQTMDELEELVRGDAQGHPQLLAKIEEELAKRTTRKAASLRKLIRSSTLGAKQESSTLGYIGLEGQTDALPDRHSMLKFALPIWSEEDTEDGTDEFFHVLAEALLSGFIVGSLQAVGDWLTDIAYIGPLRDLPARGLKPIRTPDKARWAKGLAAWEMLHRLPPRKVDEINFWLSPDCLNTGYRIQVQRFRELPEDSPLLLYLERDLEVEDRMTLKELIEELPVKTRVDLLDEKNDLAVMAQDIGVGISQLLPVVVLTITQESGLIAVEQPELHIHPAIQVELADLFARSAIEHHKVMLLETHSEHVMLRLLRRIREQHDQGSPSATMLKKEDVSVVYVQPSSTGTRFEQLRIDDDGDFLDEWPHGFFEERDEEFF